MRKKGGQPQSGIQLLNNISVFHLMFSQQFSPGMNKTPNLKIVVSWLLATTWIRPIHAHRGKTITQTLADRTNYIKNKEKTSLKNAVAYVADSEKTDTGELVTAYGCSAELADMEFALSKREYENITGRRQNNDILAYHVRQAFKPGEVTPELANQLGQALARKFTKNAHAFIVATHVDRAHIHNHIIFNSTTMDCTQKFQNPLRSNRIIRRISDQICLENGLSVIENPKSSRGHYGTWVAVQKMELLIDLQNNIKVQTSPGYAHWATVFTLKQKAKMLLFLQENGLTDMGKLKAAAQRSKDEFNAIQSEIHSINTRLEQISTLQRHIGTYRKTRDIFVQYRKAKDKRTFYAEHEEAIDRHEAAKEYFDRINLKKLPTIAALKQEYATLSAEKKALYKDYHPKRKFMREVLTAQMNAEMVLRPKPTQRGVNRGDIVR